MTTDLIEEVPALPAKLLTIAEACECAARLTDVITETDIETISGATGRALAEDVRAVRPCPSFDQSAMDGYALPAGRCLLPGTRILVNGRIAAGHEGSPLGSDVAVKGFYGGSDPGRCLCRRDAGTCGACR